MNESILRFSRRRVIATLCLLLLRPLSDVRAQDDLAILEEAAFKEAASTVSECIVQIRTIGGLDQRDGVFLGSGPTTGLIIESDGWIVSSAFNFAEQPSSILITLPGGDTAAARLVATDHSRMLVLLKVEAARPLPTPPNAGALPRVGQWALALGKAYSSTRVNVSSGIVSANDRMHGRAIQTDAKVSSSNYGGPLIDIRGQILGILVPMSPQGDSSVAGAEWYDSGIGFAIPIQDVLAQLEVLKEGRDLWPGKLGIALKTGPAYSTPAQVAGVEPNSPAAEADIKKGDIVTAVDGFRVASQTDFFFQLKPRYAGELITLELRRGDQVLSREVTLIDKLRPYVPGFLGVLPERTTDVTDATGVKLRFVYPSSPAAIAGLQPGDHITQIGDTALAARADAFAAMQGQAAGQDITIQFLRVTRLETVTVSAAKLPEDIPLDVPAPHRPAREDADATVEVGKTHVALPDLTRHCPAYVPRTYHPDMPHAVLVWIAEAQGENAPIDEWTTFCDRHDIILLAPTPHSESWEADDVEYLTRLLRETESRYRVDPYRVVMGGSGRGANAALALGAELRERVRGIFAHQGGPPAGVRFASDSSFPLSFLFAFGEKDRGNRRIQDAVEVLREAALPVTEIPLGTGGRDLNDDLRASVANWIDTLDRL